LRFRVRVIVRVRVTRSRWRLGFSVRSCGQTSEMVVFGINVASVSASRSWGRSRLEAARRLVSVSWLRASVSARSRLWRPRAHHCSIRGWGVSREGAPKEMSGRGVICPAVTWRTEWWICMYMQREKTRSSRAIVSDNTSPFYRRLIDKIDIWSIDRSGQSHCCRNRFTASSHNAAFFFRRCNQLIIRFSNRYSDRSITFDLSTGAPMPLYKLNTGTTYCKQFDPIFEPRKLRYWSESIQYDLCECHVNFWTAIKKQQASSEGFSIHYVVTTMRNTAGKCRF